MSCKSITELEEQNELLRKRLSKLEINRERWIAICKRAEKDMHAKIWLVECDFSSVLPVEEIKVNIDVPLAP